MTAVLPRGVCGHGTVPCGAPARLYPHGWRCDTHSPAAARRLPVVHTGGMVGTVCGTPTRPPPEPATVAGPCVTPCDPLLPRCQLCPASPTYWRATATNPEGQP